MRRRELFAWMVLWLLTSNFASAQIVLSEIMFRAPVAETDEEFIELYNLSATEWVDLSSYRIGDQSELDSLVDCGHGFLLPPKSFALILDPDYWGGSTIYDAVIDQDALLLTVDDGSFGSGGLRNSPLDTVKIVDPNGIVIASYAYSSDNFDGFSEEKLRIDGKDTPDNWANSLTYLGTPGFVNSVQPPELDLEVVRVWAEPSPLPWNTMVHLTAVVRNVGLESVPGGEVAFLLLDSYGAASDSLLGAVDFPWLDPLDSVQVALAPMYLPPGPQRVAVLHSLVDANPGNDSLSLQLFCGYPSGSLIINEYMAYPNSNYCEWIELFNPGTYPVNLQAFTFSDVDTAIKVWISDTSCWVEPSGYALLAQDSSIFDLNLPSEVLVFQLQSAWRNLNNDGDWIALFDAAGGLQDLVDYYGRTLLAGISMERISPGRSSSDPQNWRFSADSSGCTPGSINSTPPLVPVPNGFAFDFEPDPFDPDRHESLRIRVQTPTSVSAAVFVYDLLGRKLKCIFDEQIPAGIREVAWNGKNRENRRLSPGLYILLAEYRDPNGMRQESIKKTLTVAGKL